MFGDQVDRNYPIELEIKHITDTALVNRYEISVSQSGCRGRDRMVVGFTITYAISAYHH